MWDRPNGFYGNDISSNIKNFSLFLSFSGIITLIKSFLGKLWYLNVSTFGIFTFTIIYIIKCVYELIKHDNIEHKNYFMFFLFFCILGTLSIATICMNDVQILENSLRRRIDTVFYGRYSDILTGISFVLGIIYLSECIENKNYIVALLSIFVTFIATILCFSCVNTDNIYVNTLCVPGIYFLKKFNFISFSFISVICFINLYFIFFLKKYKMLFFFIFMYLVNFYVFENSYYEGIKLAQNYMYENFTDVSSLFSNNLEYPIYVYVDIIENKSRRIDYVNNRKLRAYIPKGKLFYCDNLQNIEENEYFFVTNKFDEKYLKNNFYIYNNSSCFCVFAHGTNLIERLKNQGRQLFYSSNILKYDNFDIFLKKNIFCIKQNKDLKIDIKFLCKKNILLMNKKDYKLSYHVYDKNGQIILWDNKRYDIGKVYNGLEFEMFIDSQVLKNRGKYILEIDMVEEQVCWFLSKNGKSKKIYLEIL